MDLWGAHLEVYGRSTAAIFATHWPLIGASTAFWFVVQFVARAVAPGWHKEHKEYTTRVAATIHSAVASAAALYIIMTPDAAILADDMYGYSKRA
jgi:hypothetical protein